ncbi:MAG: hypothetical protein JRH13_04825 [Deltaproteobacteria bacterium]|nr:hypothetical protein [Deltaproteobacteria bacterium]MBW2015783.1 hypothetical protein [Deltaproteobacteria bacterium]MBW2128667.1 hypothetical protein [Deltaproteobacteria bacterium]MBW2302646.1 hypothetical protein [Deltaproteobacteria bacterium]
MNKTEDFIKAYYEFKDTVDFSKSGYLPDLDNLVWMLLMGIPSVPADKDTSDKASMEAVDQRISILKAVFVEVNREQPEEFLDKGLLTYDQAGKMAKLMLNEKHSKSGSRCSSRRSTGKKNKDS